MKNLRLAFIAMLFALLSVVGANKAQAQTAADLAAGLVNLQQGLINANVVIQNVTLQDVIDIGDINVLNGSPITVVVTDVLNNTQIALLNDFLKNITIDNVLNNLLRDANIITDNQIVVGVLSGAIVVADKRTVRNPR